MSADPVQEVARLAAKVERLRDGVYLVGLTVVFGTTTAHIRRVLDERRRTLEIYKADGSVGLRLVECQFQPLELLKSLTDDTAVAVRATGKVEYCEPELAKRLQEGGPFSWPDGGKVIL